MSDNIVGNVAQIEHLDGNIAQVDDYLSGNISQLDYLSGNLNSSGDQQTVYRGYSAYEIALQQGFEGSKDEWLRALVGQQGEPGISISDVRLNEDFTLTVTLDDGTEFTTGPIKGDKGDKGQKGDKGDKGESGLAFTYEDFTSEQLEQLRGPQGIQGLQGQIGPAGPQGPQGLKGDKGTDGISPTVIITTITGGHRIMITDANGVETINVMDGATPDLINYAQFTDLATTTKAGVMSAQDKKRLDDVYADYSSALTVLGVI